MKNRSYGAVLSAAFRTFGNNFRQIFRHTWLYALPFSAVSAFYFVYFIQSAGTVPSPLTHIIRYVFLLAMFIANIVYYGRAAMLFNGRSQKWNTVRTAKLNIWAFVISIVAGFIFALLIILLYIIEISAAKEELAVQNHITWSIYAIPVIIIAFVVLVLPYIYVFMKYYMEPETHISKLTFSGYKTGIRHLGFIFVTVLLTSLCLAGISCVLFLPFLIAMAAAGMSQAGIINGDEPGIPGHFHWIVFSVTMISYFVYTFAGLFSSFVGYYIYGCIETKEAERKELTSRDI